MHWATMSVATAIDQFPPETCRLSLPGSRIAPKTALAETGVPVHLRELNHRRRTGQRRRAQRGRRGGTVYVGTTNGLSVFTNGMLPFTRYTNLKGTLFSTQALDVSAVYAVGSTVYAASAGNGLGIGT